MMKNYIIENFDSKILNSEKTAQGFIKVKARIAKLCVQKYAIKELGNKTLKGLRSENIFSDVYASSIITSPITINHPRENGKNILIDASNTKKYAVGHVLGKPYRKDEYLLCDLVLTADEGIKAAESGIDKISLGYECIYTKKSGNYNGEDYDFIIDSPVNNHIAMCSSPRSEDFKLRLGIVDSLPVKEVNHMKTIIIGDSQISLDDKDYSLISSHLKQLEAKNGELVKSCDSLEAKYDSLDANYKKLKESASKFDTKSFFEFRNLLDIAEKELGKESFDSIDFTKDFEPIKLKKMVLSHSNPDLEKKYQEKSDSYIDAAFDAYLDFKGVEAGKSGDKFGENLSNRRHEDSQDPFDRIRKLQVDKQKRDADAWKDK